LRTRPTSSLTIGTSRNACIQLADNILSESFELGKGHAQGDSPSPILYNLAARIQIFRIEFDPNIKQLVPVEEAPREDLAPAVRYKGEGLGQTSKNESFADDSSNLIAFSLGSLQALKSVLDEFRIISGLSRNLEKSFVMRIGNLEGNISHEIRELGFSFVDKINLLGFTLQNYGDMTATNYEKVNAKIDNLIRFWERFFLSLPGKITIYKSFLIPQINYVATVLSPNQNTLLAMEKKMEQFVTKGFSLARGKIYALATEGGMGLFPLRDFIAALQCGWLKRCHNNINDLGLQRFLTEQQLMW
jgi:hypothetical protein